MYGRDADKTTTTDRSRRAPAQGAARSGSTSRAQLLALQGRVGNAALSRALAARAVDPSQAESGPAEGPDRQHSNVHGVLSSPGRPLDSRRKQEMETRLGADFSDVRIHDGAAASTSAAEIGARAYTSGSHVVIGNSGADDHTLAHELTHVLQQRQGQVSGHDIGSGLKVSDPGDRFERAAESNARAVMARKVRSR